MSAGSPFHEGEQEAQQRAGQAVQAMRVAGILSDRSVTARDS